MEDEKNDSSEKDNFLVNLENHPNRTTLDFYDSKDHKTILRFY